MPSGSKGIQPRSSLSPYSHPSSFRLVGKAFSPVHGSRREIAFALPVHRLHFFSVVHREIGRQSYRRTVGNTFHNLCPADARRPHPHVMPMDDVAIEHIHADPAARIAMQRL